MRSIIFNEVRNPWHPKKVYGRFGIFDCGLDWFWTSYELGNRFLNYINAYCPYFHFLEKSVDGGNFWTLDLENTFKNETVAAGITKRSFTRWKLCLKRVNDEKYIFRKYQLSHFAKRGKLRGLGELFSQIFRKYFPRRNYGRKRG